MPCAQKCSTSMAFTDMSSGRGVPDKLKDIKNGPEWPSGCGLSTWREARGLRISDAVTS